MTPFLLWHLLDKSTRVSPERVALVDGSQCLTYGELDAQSNQVAHVLREQGVGIGDRVGLYLDKSSIAVVSIFGILKAGAAYVPLAPRSPVTRIAMMVNDCELAGLVSDSAKVEALWPLLHAPPPCLIVTDHGPVEWGQRASGQRVDWQEVMRATPAAPTWREAIERDLAYILYTSGSTGRPKGVMLDHRAALTFVNWAVDYFQVQPEDRLANHAPLHFDLSTFDLFAAVAVGATIVLVPETTAIFPYSLAAWMAETRVTIWYSVPSALIQLVLYGELGQHDLSALRLVLFAGEVFPAQHLRRLQQVLPAPGYYNLYGPTESNVCTVFPVPVLPSEQVAPCPIGRACANTQVFALNEAGHLVGAGEEGELYVRGPGLMRGYWKQPDATSAVLLPNPLDPTSSERVYRTGDLVRLDDEGNYHFVGRRDGMVKSRGYRIELGEIEAALHRHPAVVEAAVIPVPDITIGNRLLAFVALGQDSTASKEELESICRTHLPRYMIPERIEFLDSLPRTSTGKIDRVRLQSQGYST